MTKARPRERATVRELLGKARAAARDLTADDLVKVTSRAALIQTLETEILQKRILANCPVPRSELALGLGIHPTHASKIERRVAARFLALVDARRRRSQRDEDSRPKDDGQDGA